MCSKADLYDQFIFITDSFTSEQKNILKKLLSVTAGLLVIFICNGLIDFFRCFLLFGAFIIFMWYACVVDWTNQLQFISRVGIVWKLCLKFANKSNLKNNMKNNMNDSEFSSSLTTPSAAAPYSRASTMGRGERKFSFQVD